MSEFIANDQQPETPQAQPQFLSPTRGFHWLERGLSEIYVPQFGQWFLAALVLQSLATLGTMLHGTVGIAFQVLMSLFMAGGIIGAHAVYNNQSINAAQFFAAFTHPKKLSVLGLALLFIAIGAILVYTVIGFIGEEAINAVDWEKLQQPNNQEYQATFFSSFLMPNLKWLIGAFMIYMMASWFGNALVLLNNSNPFSAVNQGFIGFAKNILGFLVLLVIMVLILIILGFVGSLVSMLVSSALGVLGAVIMNVLIGALILPLFVSISYISYREVFLGDVKKSATSL